ncbi:MAG TPA: glycosyltransferase [Candidatus Cloacimonadota bacterium]|nr:glycosyltransferase [Candidatus Cloacimonadota bacterium]HOV17322.1 glycosyltransferase [Candidatus Cloacimonadota bacterium]HQL14430.1 glycosyltransferase [Candidatus Cloacimonadota bacterium]
MQEAVSLRLLLLAYYYPPLGGPAVQRPCKLVKYLRQYGSKVDVITIRDTLYHSKDETLLTECVPDRLFRTASFDPLYLLNKIYSLLPFSKKDIYGSASTSTKNKVKSFFPIDDKIGWVPFAVKAGKKALLTNKYDAVMVTCSPFSAILAAQRIARFGKLPLVLDYRDHWTLNNFVFQHQGRSFQRLQKLEQKCLREAALVLTSTSAMKDDLTANFGSELKAKILPFYNGYDEADFIDLKRQRQSDGKIRITYLGTLYGERSLTSFLQAFQQVQNAYPERDLEFWLVGNFPPEIHAEIEQSGIANKVVFIPQQPHKQALQLMLDTDILLLVIGDEKTNWSLPGKLFEYLRCRRPILALTDKNSEAAKILLSCGHKTICPQNDVDAIGSCLEELTENIPVDENLYQIPYEYERGRQVRMLCERLSEL